MARYDGAERVLNEYKPTGGWVNHDSILNGIDLIEGKKVNEYHSDKAMVRLQDDNRKNVAHLKRMQIFQLIINLIDEALAIVGPSLDIDDIRASYYDMLKGSRKALDQLDRKGKGGTMDLGNNALRESRHQKTETL